MEIRASRNRLYNNNGQLTDSLNINDSDILMTLLDQRLASTKFNKGIGGHSPIASDLRNRKKS